MRIQKRIDILKKWNNQWKEFIEESSFVFLLQDNLELQQVLLKYDIYFIEQITSSHIAIELKSKNSFGTIMLNSAQANIRFHFPCESINSSFPQTKSVLYASFNRFPWEGFLEEFNKNDIRP